jgi:hypothetical protein
MPKLQVLQVSPQHSLLKSTMVLIIKEMQFSYYVVIQHLFTPLDKEFVV